VEAINALYRQELRLWMNLYLPSVKLMKKVRVGSKVRRVYSAAQTPFERVLQSGQANAQRVAEFKRLRSTLDPFELARSIDCKLEAIYALANRRLSPKAATARGATAAAVGLHLLRLDSTGQSYILKWLDAESRGPKK
jgi:hypothetical protein